MRQKFPPSRSRSAYPQWARPPTPPEPAASPPVPTASRLARARVRLLRWRERARTPLLIVLGMVIALGALFAYDVVQPGSPRLTERDMENIAARVMASATPPPSLGSRVYDRIAPSVVLITTRQPTKPDQGVGTGVIIDATGTILTCFHVVKDASEITVLFADNTQSVAEIADQDPTQDIAVLRVQQLPAQVVPAVLGSPGALNVGDEVFALGNPLGLRHSLTAGVVSALRRSVKSTQTGTMLQNLIQFDAAINPGNSGGPLLNRDGEVVGIVSSLLNPTDQEVFIGIGFAVPIETAGGVGGAPPF